MGDAAFGTTLSISGTVAAELTSIGGPSVSMDNIDLSNHDSADRAREFVAGMIDGGELTMEGNLVAAHIGLLTNMGTGGVIPCVVTFPTADPKTHWTFHGIVTALSSDTPYEDKAAFSATMKVTGLPTLGKAPVAMEGETGALNTDDIVITMSKKMDDTNLLAGDFKYQRDGGADLDFSAAALDAGDATKIELTPTAGTIQSGEVVTVSYTAGTLEADDGGVLASFTGFAVTNNVT